MAMPAEELHLLIAGYVLGDLSPEEAAEFEQILAQDPAIVAEIAQMQSALETTYGATEVVPPPHLRSHILGPVDQGLPQTEHNLQPEPTSLPTRSRPFSSLRSWLEIAAVVLLIALGINNYRLSRALQASQAETLRYAALTYQLQATQANSSASAQVMVDPNTLKGRLTVQNLPPLPAGKVYVLWTVLDPTAPFTTDTKDAILTQTFQVNDRGASVQEIVVPPAFRSREFVSKVAVTIEDAATPQKHVGKPIMVAKL